MTDYRFPFDDRILLGLNGLDWGWLDALWVASSDRIFGVGTAVVLGGWLLFTLKRKAIRPLLGAALAIALTDTVGHLLLKPLFHRLRPPFALPPGALRVLVDTAGTTGSMPSLHAANSFAFAVALGLGLPGSFRFTLPIATLIAVSRIGVGVHWPSDVVAGAIYGSLVGLLIHLALRA